MCLDIIIDSSVLLAIDVLAIVTGNDYEKY